MLRVRCWTPASILLVAVLLITTATTDAGATSGPKTLAFSGYSWTVKSSTGSVGPGPNLFSDSPENVFVDTAGQLHLRITYRVGLWRSAEVILDRSLGYGTYRFALSSPVGDLDPNVVLGLFTWSDDPAYNHREIDIEVAKWGDVGTTQNAQYVVHPSDRSGNVRTFVQPDAANTSHGFMWAPNRVSFRSTTADGSSIANWSYSGQDVPKKGDERIRLNLWLDGGAPPIDGAEAEVVVSGFSFTPR